MHKILIIAVCCMPMQALTTDELSVSDLLDKYTANQDRLQSLIVKTEETIVNNWSDRTTPEFKRWISELRLDGKRIHHSLYRWLHLPTKDAPTPIEDAQYHFELWDGKRHTGQSKSIKTNDRTAYVSTNEEYVKRNLNIGYSGAPFLGIRYSDYKRIDSVLRQADSISIRDELEQVGSIACYVIDAKTKSGTYTVWIDPEHGYNIAKADIRLGPKDLYCGRRLKDNESESLSIRNVRFENVNGVYVPMEADLCITANTQNGVTVRSAIHHKITQIILEPDHDALGSFIPHLEDGEVVRDLDNGMRYTWQNGKLVPQIDEYVIDEIDKMAEEIMAEGEVPPGLATAKKTEAAPNEPATPSDTLPKTQVDTVKTRTQVVAESGSLPIVLVILIGFLIIGLIAWMVFRRLKA